MKLSVSIPDPLWTAAQRLGDGPSDIVQSALRAALGAEDQSPRPTTLNLDDEERETFRIAAVIAHNRMAKEYKHGYRFGLWLASAMTSDDAELLDDRAAAIGALRDLIGSFRIPVGKQIDEGYDDLAILDEYGKLEDPISLPLYLMARSTVCDPNKQVEFGFGELPVAFDDPQQHLEALFARAGVTDECEAEDARHLRLSRRYVEGMIDAMLAVWTAATASLHQDTRGALEALETLLESAPEADDSDEVSR